MAPENWKGKRGKHLKRVLAEAHDAAIILINPTDADKFLAVSMSCRPVESYLRASAIVCWVLYIPGMAFRGTWGKCCLRFKLRDFGTRASGFGSHGGS